MIVKKENFANELIPRIIADEYHNCNFSFKMPLDKNGDRVGHPLNVKAKYVQCNLTNREPHQEAELIQCNTTIADVEVHERIEVDHSQEIKDSNLSEETKTEMLKTTQIESKRIIITPYKVYGKYNPKTKSYDYRDK